MASNRDIVFKNFIIFDRFNRFLLGRADTDLKSSFLYFNEGVVAYITSKLKKDKTNEIYLFRRANGFKNRQAKHCRIRNGRNENTYKKLSAHCKNP